MDHMVKDFHLFEYNKGMETRKWSEDDKRRSKDFITAIEKRFFRSEGSIEVLKALLEEELEDIHTRLIKQNDIDIWTSDALQTLPSHSESFKRFLFHFSRRLKLYSIDLLTSELVGY
ncbi:hypothetical protein Tco_1436931 [Tanacetum coccineum]